MLLNGQACHVAEVGVPFAACAASSHGNPVSAVDSRPSGPQRHACPMRGHTARCSGQGSRRR
jgi:hypothetical protein